MDGGGRDGSDCAGWPGLVRFATVALGRKMHRMLAIAITMLRPVRPHRLPVVATGIDQIELPARKSPHRRLRETGLKTKSGCINKTTEKP